MSTQTIDAAWKAANDKIDAGQFTRADWNVLLAMALALPRPQQDQQLEAVSEIGLLEGVVTDDELERLLPEEDDA